MLMQMPTIHSPKTLTFSFNSSSFPLSKTHTSYISLKIHQSQFLTKSSSSFFFHTCRNARFTPAPSMRPSQKYIQKLDIRAMASLEAPSSSSSSSSNDKYGNSFSSVFWELYTKLADFIVTGFPVWIVLASLIALKFPLWFSGISNQIMAPCVSLLMMSMGVTLSLKELVESFKKPRSILAGFVGCYGLMPLASVLLARCFHLSSDLTVGLILLGIVSGGQASNLCTYIANGDTALSITMTTVSTIAAIVFLPLLSKVLIGSIIPISPMSIASSTLQVVLLPIAIGTGLNRFAPKLINLLKPALPVIAIVASTIIVLGAVAKCSAGILANLAILLSPVVLLHIVGGLYGYFVPKALDLSEKSCRTIAIETAFKSPALSYVIAVRNFESAIVQLPSAVSIFCLLPLVATFSIMLRYIPVNGDQRRGNE